MVKIEIPFPDIWEEVHKVKTYDPTPLEQDIGNYLDPRLVEEDMSADMNDVISSMMRVDSLIRKMRRGEQIFADDIELATDKVASSINYWMRDIFELSCIAGRYHKPHFGGEGTVERLASLSVARAKTPKICTEEDVLDACRIKAIKEEWS